MTPNSPCDPIPKGFIDLLKMLIRYPSVVSAEHSFFRVLQRELEECGANVSWYEGVLVAQGSDPMSCMFSAHIDRHGLICTGPNEFQYAAFVAGARSDLLGNSVSESLMQKIVTRFDAEDVYAYEPWSGVYRGKGIITSAKVCPFRNNLIFKVQGLEHLVAGTPVAFNDKLTMTNQALVGQLDNILTAAALVYLFEQGFQGTAFFTAQEEAGKSWRYLLEWFRRFGGSTNRLFVVDTSPYPNFETAQQQLVVLRNKDANAEFNSTATQHLVDICQQRGYSYQFKDQYVDQQNIALARAGEPLMSLGATEMGRIINASDGLVDGTTIQIPSSGYHTMSESAPLESVNAFLDIIQTLGGLSHD